MHIDRRKALIIETPEKKTDSLRNIPFGVTAYYKSLAHSQDPKIDPIAAQFVPREEEYDLLPYETRDPISDKQFLKTPRLIHHYKDRALLLVNDRCAVYCRHCFRRHFTGNDHGKIRPDEIDQAVDYLESNGQVKEILLSGGDPLMLSDKELFYIIDRLKALDSDLIIRIATRVPVVLPKRITAPFCEKLSQYKALWMVIHTNHPREISQGFEDAIRKVKLSGVSILNQAVLLKGVNNSVEILEELFRGLLVQGIKPYYLFQADLASGTRHFRTSIEEGLQLMNKLRLRLSGMGMPTYAVDLPKGGGKVPLHEGNVSILNDDFYEITDLENKKHRYPRELS